ncbi:MAG: dTDP-4-dehydrorhamnose reductase [Pseudomonadota bacterium]
MTILVFGKTGQVSRELQKQVPNAMFLGREEADLEDPEACAAALSTAASKHGVRGVINAAAYTAVDRAESEPEIAQTINGDAPGAMARAAAAAGVPFVHISTDYVFDGSGEVPWAPVDLTGPLGAYGHSKLAGEEAVHAAHGTYAILRTSWVVSAHGSNFVKTMLRLGSERESLSIVADQVGGPTGASEIAAACLAIVVQLAEEPEKSGTYHFSGYPDVSWADFAREIFAQSGTDCQVADIPARDYPTPAPRPHNSRLDCSATKACFGIARPDWRKSLAEILEDLSTQ